MQDPVQFDRPRRVIQLGLDYGTSWSKLVYRDDEARGQEKSWIVWRGELQGRPDFRIPSLVAREGGRLYFGCEAERRRGRPGATVWPSLKIRAALPDEQCYTPSYPLPPGLGAAELATLTVHHLLQEGVAAVTEYGQRAGVAPVVSMRLGVPLPSLVQPESRDIYLSIAQDAYNLYRLGLLPDSGNRLALDDAATALAFVRSRRAAVAKDEIYQWLLPELAAGLIWAFFSPRVKGGLYAAVDVGAGSTDAAFFRIEESFDHESKSWQKSRLSLWGGSSRPPGVDAVDEAIARVLPVADQLDLRLCEQEHLQRLSAEQLRDIDATFGGIFAVYTEAFHAAFQKDPHQSHWDQYGLFLFGGGTRIQRLVEHLHQPALRNFGRDVSFVDPGVPLDLGGWRSYSDAAFCLVAYGLAYGMSFAEFDLPPDVPPAEIDPRTRRRRLEPDELSEAVLKG